MQRHVWWNKAAIERLRHNAVSPVPIAINLYTAGKSGAKPLAQPTA
ncbi:MAG: hypothetical protein MO852_09350 [Candidatus Devosia euplotis]|nr:hypothetical protein [Candidatus Devosia euplotis]